MNIRLVGRMVSSILFVTEVFMIPSLILCCIDDDHDVAMAFLASMAVISLIAGVLLWFGRKREAHFSARDGFVTVALA